MFNFNTRLFAALGSDLTFASLSNYKVVFSSNIATSLFETLDTLLLELTDNADADETFVYDDQKIINCQAALSTYIDVCAVLLPHIKQRLSTILDDLQVAKIAQQIDIHMGINSDIINDITTSLTDTAVNIMDDAISIVHQINTLIDEYHTDIIDIETLTTSIDNLTPTLNTSSASMTEMVDNELAAIQRSYDMHSRVGKTYALESLMSDDTARSIIDQFASGNLAIILADEFGLGL